MEKEKQKLFSNTTTTIEVSLTYLCHVFYYLCIYQYRDRAKERRDKFGMVAIVPGWKKRFELERARESMDIDTDNT